MGLKDRLSRLEDEHRPEPEDERERKKWRVRIREAAERSIEHSRREGKEPVFEINDGGDVSCTHDGRPVTEWRQTLAEEWYWQELSSTSSTSSDRAVGEGDTYWLDARA